jgi:hypothetical protein
MDAVNSVPQTKKNLIGACWVSFALALLLAFLLVHMPRAEKVGATGVGADVVRVDGSRAASSPEPSLVERADRSLRAHVSPGRRPPSTQRPADDNDDAEEQARRSLRDAVLMAKRIEKLKRKREPVSADTRRELQSHLNQLAALESRHGFWTVDRWTGGRLADTKRRIQSVANSLGA